MVTALAAESFAAQAVDEQEDCGRGDMENRIKEQQRMLFADRVSGATRRASQVRLCLATVASLVLRALRPFGLAETELAQAPGDTIRVKLRKLGAVVRVGVRRVWLSLSESYPLRAAFARVVGVLRQLAERPLEGMGLVRGTG